MEKLFSKSWKSSTQRRKQRKYRFQAPLHIKRKFVSMHLSDDLKKKYNKRSVIARKGDTVKVMRGQFKGKQGKIETLNTKESRVILAGIEVVKKDGSKARFPIHASNLLLVEVIIDDKERVKSLQRKQTP